MISCALRLDLPGCRARLRERLAEAAPARIQLLSGPRQVGKTTLLLELADAAGAHGLYVACRFLDAEENLKQARLLLIAATRQVLQGGLAMLGVSAPEKM